MYGHLWGTPAVRAVFDERARLQSWLDVLAALARAQAAEGIVPAEAAEAITDAGAGRAARPRAGRRADPAHRALDAGTDPGAASRCCPPEVHQHVYVGATVQDLTDTWTVTGAAHHRRRGLARPASRRGAAARPRRAAPRHRARRTHPRATGCAGHVRLEGGRLGRRGAPPPRPAARGRAALAGRPARRRGRHAWRRMGPAGLAVRRRFCAELGLADPGISWLTARDRVAEVGAVLAMVTGTLARIGGEVYELQRPEIGELREPIPGRHGRQHHDAAQAQSRAQRAPRHPRPAGPGQRRRAAGGHGRASTSATGAAGRPSGWRCPRCACSPRPRSRSPSSCWTACEVDAAAMRRKSRQLHRQRTRPGPARRRGSASTPRARPAGQLWSTGRASGRPMGDALQRRRPADSRGGRRRWHPTPAPRERWSTWWSRGLAPLRARGEPDVAVTAPARTSLAVLPTPLVAAPRLADALGLSGSLLRQAGRPHRLRGRGQQGPPARVPPRRGGCRRTPTSWSPAARSARTSCRPRPPPRRSPGWACVRCARRRSGRPRRPPEPCRRRSAWGAQLRWTGEADRTSVDATLPEGRRAARRRRGPARTSCRAAEPTPPARSATGWPSTRSSASSPGRDARRWSSPVGAGGTLAGLVAGVVAHGRPFRVVGAQREPVGRATSAARVLDLARRWRADAATSRRRRATSAGRRPRPGPRPASRRG